MISPLSSPILVSKSQPFFSKLTAIEIYEMDPVPIDSRAELYNVFAPQWFARIFIILRVLAPQLQFLFVVDFTATDLKFSSSAQKPVHK